MVKEIRLVNCQSWLDSTITLATDRVNVLCAENNVGKSVLFKMLKITADPKHYSRAERKELIHWGKTFAMIVFVFDDMTAGYTKVLVDRVIYGYIDTSGTKEFLEPPSFLLDKIGLMTSNGFVANIIDTEQDLMLVNPALKANYELMNLLVYNEELETLRNRVSENLDVVSKINSKLASKSDILQHQLRNADYKDIDRMQHDYTIASNCYELIYNIIIPTLSEFTKINEIKVKNFKLIESVLSLLEIVSEQLPIVIPEFKDLDSIFELVNIVNNDLPDKVPKFSNMDAILDLLFNVEQVSLPEYVNEIINVEPCINLLEQIEKISIPEYTLDNKHKLDTLLNKLNECNAIVNCELYGSVIFDGKECVPCDI